MFLSCVVISVLVCIHLPAVLLGTIPDFECSSQGAECVHQHQCPEEFSLSSLGKCPEDKVCCWSHTSTNLGHGKNRIVKALYMSIDEKGLPSNGLLANMEYTIDQTDGDIDPRIVNVELLNNKLLNSMGPTRTTPKTVKTKEDIIVFPDKREEQIKDRTEYLKMLFQKYAKDFQNYNLKDKKKRPKYTVGERSSKHCKLYESLSVDESLHSMPLLPFPVLMENHHCSKPLPLIVSGINATKGEFPHMAGLGYDRGEWMDFLCGGSLISERYVLTAAHCAKTKWGPPIVVRLGTRNLITDEGQNMDVEEVILHPDYEEPSSYNDIALVKIAAGLNLSKILRPACLPSPNTPAGEPGRHLTATGWGRTGYGLYSSPNLQKVSLAVMDNKTCDESFLGGRKSDRLPNGIQDSILCAAGYMDPSHDTCQGDSGGPLQAMTAHSKCMYEIIGITSFGKLCGTGLPAIYTRVSSYISWIEDIVWPS